MDGIFISYRRDDSAGHAGRLFDRLKQRFGAERVFMDVTDIVPGTDFVDAIERALASCCVLVTIIGRDWLTCTDQSGQPRIDNPHDFVYLETYTGLKRAVPVIPVLVEGASMPRTEALPRALQPLTRFQAVALGDAHWDADVFDVIDAIENLLAHKAAQSLLSRLHACVGQPWRKGLALMLLVAIILGLTRVLFPGSHGTAPPVATLAPNSTNAMQASRNTPSPHAAIHSFIQTDDTHLCYNLSNAVRATITPLFGELVSLPRDCVTGALTLGETYRLDATGTDGISVSELLAVNPFDSNAILASSHKAFEFGTVAIGARSADQVIAMTNEGSGVLKIHAAGMIGVAAADYVLKTDCQGLALKPKQQCTLSVHFKPTARDVRYAMISVDYLSRRSPLIIKLSGAGAGR
ncbi:MAG: TIR domain-containing protein [Gammaproteobacteria bacterium]|nr:TIR domain-containing protein [Gammaproteobacteria bacterium]